jgi:glycosidase
MIDESLSEPALGLGPETEFKAFVEAAHRLGLRVVVEFVFRTASKDGDWIAEHPSWFYWIKEKIERRPPDSTEESRYGSPVFTPQELEHIHRDVNAHRLDNLLPPHEQYRKFFTVPPDPKHVAKKDGRYLGTLADGSTVKIPGAFADWPPDDSQPPWGDVTYLRMYTNPDFNYIAYNTIRMYDLRLTRPEHINRPLWDKIVGIIPHYQKHYHIDGVMIDMGHALPMELKAEMVSTARQLDRDFAFWDENFSVTPRSREEGYNAVIGYCWVDEHHPERIKNLCRQHATEGFPIPYFSTPESHNTPRAAARPGGVTYSRWAMLVNAFLPAIPFIHSGYELAEQYPINTGLDFTREQLAQLPSENLPLFSEYAYDWRSKDEFTGWAKLVLSVRRRYHDLVVDHHPLSFVMLEDPNPSILAFARVAANGRKKLAVVTNMNWTVAQTVSLPLDTARKSVTDLLEGGKHDVEGGRITLRLRPGEGLVFEY